MTNAELADEIERSQVEIWPQEEPVSVNDGRVMTDAEKQQIIAALRQPSSDQVLVRALQMCRDYVANEKIDRRYLGELIEAAASSALTTAEAEGHHE